MIRGLVAEASRLARLARALHPHVLKGVDDGKTVEVLFLGYCSDFTWLPGFVDMLRRSKSWEMWSLPTRVFSPKSCICKEAAVLSLGKCPL